MERGNLNIRIDLNWKGEIATLAKGLNGMVEKLKKSIMERERVHHEDLRKEQLR